MSGERRRARRLEAGDPNGGGPGRGRSGPNGGEGTSTEAGRTLTVNEPHGLDVGGRAPEFGASLVRSDGTVAEVTLSECLGDGPVLLTFCALDAVPRDPEGWCALHDVGWFASDENLQVVGVSRADTRTHCRFIERFDLGYPLVSDRGGEVADRYGVCYRDPRSATSAVRSCVLVDEDREIRHRWVGEHRPEHTSTPPLGEMHGAIRREVSTPAETFGLV